jgi:hypothetical protein
MSRRFSAANDEVRYALQANANFTGAWSMAMWVDFAGANNTWQAGQIHHLSTGLYAVGWERAGPGNTADTIAPIVSGNSTTDSTATLQAADGHMNAGVSKAAGSSVARIHLYKGGSWTHQNCLAAQSNAPSQAGGSIRLGELEDTDDLDGYITADAGWAANLADADFISLTEDLHTWLNHATPPAYFHEHNQALATDDIIDLTGNGNDATGTITSTTDSSGIAGTTMDANNPAGIVFTSGTPAPIMIQYQSAMNAMRPSQGYR